jgi:hypothetical protein
VDLYAHNCIRQKRSDFRCQYLKMQQVVKYSNEWNVGDKRDHPAPKCHGDVQGIGRFRMVQSVMDRSTLVQARPVHRPAMVRILDPVRPYQPGHETQ